MKTISVCVLTFGIVLSNWLPVSAGETPAEVPHLHGATNAIPLTPAFINGLIREMESNNPAFLASRSRTNAAGAGLRAIRTWEDPTARIGALAAREELRASD